jgi:hypothetical protein
VQDNDKTLRQRQAEAQNKRQEQENKVRDMVNRVAATKDGKELLSLIKGMCNFDSNGFAVTREGAIDVNATLITASMQSVYKGLRKYIKTEYLLEIEAHNWEKPQTKE